MKYPYPELSTVVHNNQRWYDTQVGFFPSITTVLGTTAPEEMKQSLKKWQDALGPLAAEKSKAATTRGTNVHLLCERFLKGEELVQGENIAETDMASFVALKTKLKHIDEVWGQEVALYSQELELAGRCDLIGVYKGVEVIIDFKTAGRVKGHKDISEYKCQLAFYANAHNEMFGTHIEDGVILMVADTGFPMEFKVKLSEHMAELKKRAAFFWLGAVNSLA